MANGRNSVIRVLSSDDVQCEQSLLGLSCCNVGAIRIMGRSTKLNGCTEYSVHNQVGGVE